MTILQPVWYKLESKRSGKKKSIASGEVLMRFSIFDPLHTTATPQQILAKFFAMVTTEPTAEDEDLDRLERAQTDESIFMDDDEEELDEMQDEADDGASLPPEQEEKRKKKHRLARLKRRTKLKAYEFSGMSDIAGVLFLEINKITDLPPERNGKSPLSMAE